MPIILHIKQYVRNRISRIIAADTRDIRAELDYLRRVLIQRDDAPLDDVSLQISDTLEERVDYSPGFRADFEILKDCVLLRKWHSEVVLPAEIYDDGLPGELDWTGDVAELQMDLERRAKSLARRDELKLDFAQFLIGQGQISEGIACLNSSDRTAFFVAWCYLAGRACLALSKHAKALRYLETTTVRRDFRRGHSLAGHAARRTGKADVAAILFSDAIGLSDYTWANWKDLSLTNGR